MCGETDEGQEFSCLGIMWNKSIGLTKDGGFKYQPKRDEE